MVEEPAHDQPSSAGARSSKHIESVKQLLEHLYDLPFLQEHALVAHPTVILSDSSIPPSQALRRLLMRALETPTLSPDRASTPGRYLKLVYLHYVDGMTIQEAAHSLGVSERQAYRDLQKGIETVASVLWDTLNASQNTPTDAEPPPMSLRAEVDRLMPHVSTIDFGAVVHYAQRAVQKMAQQRHVDLIVELPFTPCSVRSNEVMAQQLVVRVLSQIVQSVDAATVRIRIANNPRSRYVELAICLDGAILSRAVVDSDALALQLFERLGWSYRYDTAPSDGIRLIITTPTDLRFLLVIDDNESLAELLDRYLMNKPYRIVAATDPGEGLRLVQELQPDIIMLDIMMPDMDGWELLQRLRNGSKTSNIPIIVCSVFNDPELAQSLGATLFLSKPLSRELFLDALRRLELSDSYTPP
ncbi:MAG: response regulator [Anaerolineae bacterium]|nr:response regulator [Anaerolineae bacterium]